MMQDLIFFPFLEAILEEFNTDSSPSHSYQSTWMQILGSWLWTPALKVKEKVGRSQQMAVNQETQMDLDLDI